MIFNKNKYKLLYPRRFAVFSKASIMLTVCVKLASKRFAEKMCHFNCFYRTCASRGHTFANVMNLRQYTSFSDI